MIHTLSLAAETEELGDDGATWFPLLEKSCPTYTAGLDVNRSERLLDESTEILDFFFLVGSGNYLETNTFDDKLHIVLRCQSQNWELKHMNRSANSNKKFMVWY